MSLSCLAGLAVGYTVGSSWGLPVWSHGKRRCGLLSFTMSKLADLRRLLLGQGSAALCWAGCGLLSPGLSVGGPLCVVSAGHQTAAMQACLAPNRRCRLCSTVSLDQLLRPMDAGRLRGR